MTTLGNLKALGRCEVCGRKAIAGCEKGEVSDAEVQEWKTPCPNRRSSIDDFNWLYEIFQSGKRFAKSSEGRAPSQLKGLIQAQGDIIRHLDAGEGAGWEFENIVIFGPPGTGKTDLAMMAVNQVRQWGWRALMVPVADLMAVVRSTFGDSKPCEEHELFEGLSKIDLLALDDMGKERSTDFAEEFFYRLVDVRHRDMKATIYTTNLTAQDLAKNDRTKAVARRLQEGSLRISLNEKVRKD